VTDPATLPENRVYTAPQVAALAGVSVAHVYRWAGTIPGAFRFGRLWRFRQADVDAWLAAERREDAA
jgi:excisionase family DNA binding protein